MNNKRKTPYQLPRDEQNPSLDSSHDGNRIAPASCFSCCQPGCGSSTSSHSGAQQLHEVDKVVVSELNNLTIAERQQVYEEVHGVSQSIPESPDLIRESLDKMEQAIQRIRSRKAYDKAAFLSSQYVQDPAFRLPFLRSEQFDAKKAAQKLVAYMDMKLDFFGLDALVRDLTMEEDFDEKTRMVMDKGIVSILSEPDSVGRTIVVNFFKQVTEDCEGRQLSKMLCYMLQNYVFNQERQRKGLVMVVYEAVRSGTFPPFQLERVQAATRFVSAMPFNLKAWHICYNDVRSKPTMELFKLAMGTQGRVRFRAFYGSDIECRYHLMSFGIPVHLFPVTNDGHVNVEKHKGDIQDMKGSDRKRVLQRDKKPLSYPTSKDIVFGRGPPFQRHPGNVRLNEVVRQHYVEYQRTNRSKLRPFFLKIFQILQDEEGARFLKPNKDSANGPEWVPVDESAAYKKIAHAFRNQPILSRYHEKRGHQPGVSSASSEDETMDS